MRLISLKNGYIHYKSPIGGVTMTRVLIISDSHGLTEELTEIIDLHEVDWYIHCGDSELDFDAEVLHPFYKVGGNCDFDPRYPTEEIKDIDGIRFFITHGHLHQVKSGLTTLSYVAEEHQAKVVCFGHTHIAGAEKIGEQLFINPGSIRMPRNRVEKTYAVLEWLENKVFSVQFYTVDGQKIENMSYSTTL